MRFGWLNDKNVFNTNSLIIKPILDFDTAVNDVIQSSQSDGSWYYSPIVFKTDMSSPKVVTVRYELPPTHQLLLKNKIHDQKFIEFMIVFFGWLHGLRLNPEGWGYLIKTPIKQGELSDFNKPRHADIEKLMIKAESFWYSHQQDNLANLLIGALNWYSLTQSYEHLFERFMGQYSVFDTLYKITSKNLNKNAVNHSVRFKFMSDNLKLVCPSWINEIADMRNELIHESKFAGMPIGFTAKSSQSNTLLGLKAFNCKVIASIIGAEGPYTRASCETQQLQPFDLD